MEAMAGDGARAEVAGIHWVVGLLRKSLGFFILNSNRLIYNKLDMGYPCKDGHLVPYHQPANIYSITLIYKLIMPCNH
jgi:hypothetical protein